MNTIKEHIVFKSLSVVIALILLAPATLQLFHAFHDHHHHWECDSEEFGNIHKCDFDHSLLKYTFQHYFTASQNYCINNYLQNNFEVPSLNYKFYYRNKRVFKALRAPPFAA